MIERRNAALPRANARDAREQFHRQRQASGNVVIESDGQLGVVIVGFEIDDLATMVHATRTIPQYGAKTSFS